MRIGNKERTEMGNVWLFERREWCDLVKSLLIKISKLLLGVLF
jgi:hypothetical protein